MSRQKILFKESAFPVFQQRMYDSAEDARNCPRGDIVLVQDSASGLVYNSAFHADLMNYDATYQNEQAHSSVFKDHLDQVASIVERNLGTQELVEVGCGKAFFLELLQSRGCSIAGFDPTYEGENPAIQRCYFAEGVEIAAQGVVLRHVLEHVENPVDFLAGIRDVNRGGLIYIEVPCLDWILTNKAWFDIFYEHVNYFRLDDFVRIFGRIVESGHLFGGQYIYVVADLRSLRRPVCTPKDQIVFPDNFLQAASDPSRRAAKSTVVWGAASKGVIYALLRERYNNPIRMLVDINPAKCGKYVPATGLRVASPDEAIATLPTGSTVCVMNSNYLGEIRDLTGNRFNLIGVDCE